MMFLRRWIVLLLTTLVMLAACHSPVYDQTEANAADAKMKVNAAINKSDASGMKKPSLVVKNGYYVDTTPISLKREPAWLSERIVIRGDALPFSYYSRTIGQGAYSHVLTKYQQGLDPTLNVSMNYAGTIKGALDLLAAKTGYAYTIHGNSIFWQAYITKTLDVVFLPGSAGYFMGNSNQTSSSSNSSSSSNAQTSNYVNSDSSISEFSNLSGTLSVWTDIENTVKQLLSPDGKVTVSQSTTTLTVRDRPTNVKLVEQYVANINKNLVKQVLVKVQILDVNLENDYNFGIDWNLIVKAFHNSPFTINANYGTPITITTLNPSAGVPIMGTTIQNANQVPGYTILFNALNQQGKTAVVSEPRVVCTNNQVSVVRVATSQGYVASIQNTSLSGTGSSSGGSTTVGTVTSQVTPGMVTTGLTLYILPKIMGEKVYMQVNADLSINNGFGEFGPTNSQVQLPNITEKHFNQRSIIRSGDTLILSGFRQVTNKTGANQFITSQALGGKASSEISNETIILITPIILHGTA